MTDPKALLSLMKTRRSVRRFRKDVAISDEDLHELVEAGIWAPSGSNTQNVRFLVVRDPNNIRWLTDFRGGGGALATASAAILVFSDLDALSYNKPEAIARWWREETHALRPNESAVQKARHPVWDQLRFSDSAAAIQNMLLLAMAKGIGTCWVSAYQNMNESRLLSFKSWRVLFEKFRLSESLEIMGIVALGYSVSSEIPGGEFVKSHGANAVQRMPMDSYLLGWF